MMSTKESIFKRFPPSSEVGDKKDKKNPAIFLYGRRFYRDQTAIEYLIEFLLVFSSSKTSTGDGENSFDLHTQNQKNPYYYPEDRIALKFLSFFSNSKLETRHKIHHIEYNKAIDLLKNSIALDNENEKEEAIDLIQSFLYGFVGVSKNRTWVTNCFLPISSKLISREVNWESPKNSTNNWENWEDTLSGFSNNSRNFMGRGGEVLFLQLSYIFSDDCKEIKKIAKENTEKSYHHVFKNSLEIKSSLTKNLGKVLSTGDIELVVEFVENSLSKYKLKNNPDPKPSSLGWIPQSYKLEATLFSYELNNICSATLNNIEKIDLLQTACVMQVIRTLCFQASRISEDTPKTKGFWGNYAIITCPEITEISDPSRKPAQRSFAAIEELLYRSVRHPDVLKQIEDGNVTVFKNADDNVLGHFKRFAKELKLVIPRTGKGERFALNQTLLRFFVAALITPGERIYLDTFYERLFAHYGIALNGEQLTTALQWIGDKNQEYYTAQSHATWVEETLKQGGFLIELSDSVSMVTNPG